MLPDDVRQRIEAEAKRRGIDPREAIAEAERLSKSKAQPSNEKTSESSSESPGDTGRPVADRLLIGFLPFIKVRELREHWLGLTERIADDELTCGDYQLKHGGAGQPTAPEGDA